MKRKNTSSYIKVNEYLGEDLNYDLRYMIKDFESAQYNSCNSIFTKTELCGCYFHYSQILILLIKEKRVLYKYNTEIIFQIFVKYLLFLTYIPIKSITSEFKKIIKLKSDDIYYHRHM
ncbi:hypothetical protein DMUE_3447 [Dictyocoela muelleri]|nr:hypothetical protein DMUE_3447 [Dictyocoela muelleri]